VSKNVYKVVFITTETDIRQ